jgi:hypothetical protein
MLSLLLVILQDSVPADSTAFADPRTREVVQQGIARHGHEDQAVRDYAARFRYRLSFGIGRRRWAMVPNAAVEEQEGRVQWAAPNDLRVDILGRRSSSRSKELRLSSSFDRPWFIPRSLSDSIRVFGNDIPPRAALHPLAASGPDWYHYRVTDSVQLATASGRRVKLLGVEVLPRRTGPSLVAGRLWLDAASFDLVRFSFRIVGQELWLDPEDAEEDERSARRINKIVSRLLTLDADLEYALQEERYWMPYRQVVSGRVELPWFGELVIPFEATTTFDDYEVNSGRVPTFSMALPSDSVSADSIRALARARRDSLREERRRRGRAGGDLPEDDLPRDDAGRWDQGRYEIHRAPGDSLRAYAEWGDSLTLGDDPAADRELRQLQSDLERMTIGLPGDLTGRRVSGIAWDRLGDAMRYTRVQGAAPGLAYRFPFPGDPFTTVRADARFGVSDERLTGGLTLVREAPGARWTLAGYRDVRSNDPFGRGNSFGNSLAALFVGHDDADYHLVHGARLTREASLAVGLELTTTLLVERQASVRREAKSWLNDALGGSGDFPPNPPIAEGTFGGAAIRLERGLVRSRWMLGADVLGHRDSVTARVFGSFRRALWRGGTAPIVVLRSGVTTRAPLPQQAFRIGGTGTVRGFDYGTRRGQAFWAAQLDWPLKRGLVQPVVFGDAGQAAAAQELFRSRLIAGGGAGLALLGGFLRFDLSHPITKGGSGLRFDLVARGFF